MPRSFDLLYVLVKGATIEILLVADVSAELAESAWPC